MPCAVFLMFIISDKNGNFIQCTSWLHRVPRLRMGPRCYCLMQSRGRVSATASCCHGGGSVLLPHAVQGEGRCYCLMLSRERVGATASCCPGGGSVLLPHAVQGEGWCYCLMLSRGRVGPSLCEMPGKYYTLSITTTLGLEGVQSLQ